MKNLKNTFESLHDLMSYKTFNISIDYKKKKILYNMDCYGNFKAAKIRGELKTLSEIDSRFEKIIYVSANFVEGYFTSPKYHKEILEIFEKNIFGVYPVYTGKNPGRASEKDDEFLPLTREMIEHVQDVKKEKYKIERFYRDFKKLSYVPHVKLKHFSLEKLEKRGITETEALTMIGNGQALNDIRRFFKSVYERELIIEDEMRCNPETYKNFSLDKLENLEAIGFKFAGVKYKNLKAQKVFTNLGDNEESAS